MAELFREKAGVRQISPRLTAAQAPKLGSGGAFAVGQGFEEGGEGGKAGKAQGAHGHAAQLDGLEEGHKVYGEQRAAQGEAREVAAVQTAPGRFVSRKTEQAQSRHGKEGPTADQHRCGALHSLPKMPGNAEEHRGRVHADQSGVT